MKLDGCKALITGGGTGVGRATALALAELGCSVAVNYSRSRKDAEATAEEIRGRGVGSIAVQADVAEDGECRVLVERVVKEFGGLDVLVNSAGTTSFVPHGNLEDIEDGDWDRIMGVNVRGPFQVVRAARSALEASSEGAEVINVSSVAGTIGQGSSIPYCASKAALNMLTVTLARALGPAIRVNAVAPGFITSRWLREGWGEKIYEVAKKSIEDRVPLRSVCSPEDVSAAILGLLLGSDLVTGQVLTVDGGMSLVGG